MIKPEILYILSRKGLGIGVISISRQSKQILVILTRDGEQSLSARVEHAFDKGPSGVSEALEQAFWKCINADSQHPFNLADATEGLV